MSLARDIADLGSSATRLDTVGSNLIINGAMTVAQRSVSAVAAGNPNYPSVDRYKAWEGTDGAYTVEQSTDAPTGFTKSLKAQVTTADTSLAAGQYAQILQNIEAQDCQHLDYGLSTAKTLTLSFWVKSSKTGTYCITAYKEDSTGSASTLLFPKEYTISSANTWEHKTITIEPDSQIKAATGAIDDDSGVGIAIYWNLAQGSTYTGGTDGTWSANTNHFATTNQVNWMDNTSNNFYLTGVQLEVGPQSTDFEHRSFGDQLIKCQRYYQKYAETGGSGSNAYLRYGIGQNQTTTVSEIFINSQTIMRADPTLIYTGTPANYSLYARGAVIACTGVAIEISGHSNNQLFVLTATVASGLVAGEAVAFMNNNSSTAFLDFNAEL